MDAPTDALPVAAAPPLRRKIDDGDDVSADAEMLQPAASTADDDSWWRDAAESVAAVSTEKQQDDERARNEQHLPQSQENESLVSLPSPVATPATLFDVFATAPEKTAAATAASSEKLIASESNDQEMMAKGDPLVQDMSGLSLDAEEAPLDEALESAEDVELLTSKQSEDMTENSLGNASDPADEDELATVDTHDDATEPSEPQQPKLPTSSPGSQKKPETLTKDMADLDSDVDQSARSTDGQQAPQSTESAFKNTIPIAVSPTKEDSALDDLDGSHEDEAGSPILTPTPEPTPASTSAPTSTSTDSSTADDSATAPMTNSDDRTVTPRALPPSARASPPRPNKGANSQTGSRSASAAPATESSKLKNGRVQTHPPPAPIRSKASESMRSRAGEPTKVKSGESMKVRAPPANKATLVKTKAKGGDGDTSSGTAGVKTASLKPKPQRTGSSSSSSAQENAAKAASRSPTLKTTANAAGDRQGQESTSPPPEVESDEIKSVKKRLSSSELEAASNRLYSDAIEAKKRKEARKAKLEETYTFTPQVNAKKRPSIPDEKNRFVALHEKAKLAMKRKEELRQKREKAECTFKPKITAKAMKLSKTTKPRFENLYQQAQELQLKRDVRKSESEQRAVEECSFKPKIKTMKSPTKSRPLYDAERLKQRKLALEQKKIETELSQCTFKPKVVAKAVRPKTDEAAGGKSGGEATLFDRLYQASQRKADNLEKLRHEREEQEKLVATFHPKIIVAAATKAESKQPFHERLYNKDYMQKVMAERELKKLEEEQKYTFKPQLTAVPDEIKAKRSSPSSSPDKSIFERLYEEKDKLKDKIEAGDMIRKQKEMDGCTFRPNIDVSPNRAQEQPGVPIWERLLSFDKSQVLEEREKQRQELEMQECTFKPEVTPSEFFTPKKSPSVGIFDRLTGGAASVPSSDMKRRESERKASSATHSKQRSIPELDEFKNRQEEASNGEATRSSNTDGVPETSSPDEDINQPRSQPASLQSSELKSRENSKQEAPATQPKAADTKTPSSMEKSMSSSAVSGDRSSPETSSTAENNASEQLGDKHPSDLESLES